MLAEVDPKLHNICVEAQDYLGCVKGTIKSIGAASSGVADARARKLVAVPLVYHQAYSAPLPSSYRFPMG